VLARPVRVENVANCFALSEAVDGAAQGCRVVFGVILGTGCGGGVVVDRRVVEGASGIGGEWGHTPLPWAREDEIQPRDWCGRVGCLEQWISGTGFKRWAGVSAGEANERALAGDPQARVLLDLLADRIARGLAVMIDILDPDAIVFGGGVSNIDSLYPSIRGKLIAHVFSDFVGAKVVKNKHGDSSGVRGAAWLFEADGEASPFMS
jgi:fructokinase